MVSGTAMFASSHADVEQNKNRPTSVSGTSALQRHVQVGADLLQKDEKALPEYDLDAMLASDEVQKIGDF